MPQNTAVPSAWRISAPGPVAITSGTTPRMKAKDVIRIGRSRRRQASTAASNGLVPVVVLGLLGELDDQDRVLGREADQHDEADLREDVVVHAAQPARRTSADSTPIGTIRMMASGSDQLSYCAASTRKTNSTTSAKMKMRGVAGRALLEGELRPLEARSPAAATSRARRSMVASAVPDEMPGAALPWIGTEVYML